MALLPCKSGRSSTRSRQLRAESAWSRPDEEPLQDGRGGLYTPWHPAALRFRLPPANHGCSTTCIGGLVKLRSLRSG